MPIPFLSFFDVNAFLLSLASSTDNFCVGLGVGLSGKHLPVHANAWIALMNAIGGYVASIGGGFLSSSSLSSSMAGWLASVAFFALAYQEHKSDSVTNGVHDGRDGMPTGNTTRNGKNDGRQTCLDDKTHKEYIGTQKQAQTTGRVMTNQQILMMAFPMTLNNLAGGVAGGAVGITPPMAFFYALVVSFGTMALGHAIGRSASKSSSRRHRSNVDTARFSTILYCLLGALNMYESIRSK